ncbi:MAG: thiamine pyrophosphate-binding protein [Betaproteobacteria bacterium]|nr:thiamine pyrophosphate-binding protein [Betaproteobacteria bacterium]MDH3437189.1 thiamine pyrophosphate-binding protein [Betaproteobacteria bacterium]
MDPKEHKMVNTTTGARALVDALLREGIDHVFGIPGTQNLAVIDALRDTPQIRFILTRHEQGAAFMAYGFARASGRPSVVTATEGPGVTNLATAIGAAFRGFVPVISVCGVQESSMRERDATQDMDQVPFLRPITKWAYSIPNGEKVQESVRKAFRVALTEPQGPTHIEASSEILLEQVAPEPIDPAAYRNRVLPSCNSAQLDRAYELLVRAERPVFVVGRGVLSEGVTDAMANLAERTGVPVAVLQYSPDAFSSTHALALGPLGRNGFGSANRTVPKADVIIAVGAHMDVFSTMYKYGIFSQSAKLVHHSAAPGQIGIVFPVTLGVTGSTVSFIEGLSERAAQAGRRKPWVDAAKARTDWEAELHGAVRAEAEPIQPQFVAHMIRKVLPRDGLLVVDAGNGGKHVRSYFESYEPGTFMCIDDWASVGGSLPIALGAKLARPDRPVLCASGDMGAMCNIGELETAVREKIPVVYVVLNDQGLGNERAFQQEHYGGRLYAVDYQNPDFGALAKVFGAHGEHVTKPGDLEDALRRAFASGKPAIVDVMIDQKTLAPVVYRPS